MAAADQAGLAALPLDAAVLEPQPGARHRASPTFGSRTEQTSRSRICSSAATSRLPSTWRSPQRPRLRCRRCRRRMAAAGRCIALTLPERRLPAGSLTCRDQRPCVPALGAGWRRSPGGSEQAGSVVRCSDVHDVAARRRAGCRSGAHAPARSDGCDRVVAGRRRRRQRAATTQPRATAAAVLSAAVLCPAGWGTAAPLRPGRPSAAALRSGAARAETHGRTRDRSDRRSGIVACRRRRRSFRRAGSGCCSVRR